MSGSNGTNGSARTLPHSVEAEEYLLSCCLLDGADVISRCLEAQLRPESFYDHKHTIIFERLLGLYNRQAPIDVAVLAEDLKTAKLFDQIGGYSFLTQVSSRIPTTAQTGEFINRVLEQSVLRELIRTATGAVEDCYNYTGDIEELFTAIEVRLGLIRHKISTAHLKTLADFNLPPEDGPNELLGSNRYIGRGDSCIIVSSSGMGKSSLSIIWAAHIALGRHFLGIETKRPSRSLIIQAEDSDGDMGELWFSIRAVMKLTEAEMAKVRDNVIVVRDKVNRGPAFIAHMRSIIHRVKPDFVWLNPLHAYAGCDIANAEQMGEFLRAGLNNANREEQFAYMVVHHTPKPMTGKAVADKKWHEFMYDAAGSAELVNWARAVITLKPTETDGCFNLVLAKRGKRAGVTQEVQGEVNTFLQPTTKIAIKQCSESVAITGRKRPFYLLNWEARTPDAEEPKKKHVNEGTFAKQWNIVELASYFPASNTEGEGLTSVARYAGDGCGVSKASFYRWKDRLVEDGLIAQLDNKTWHRSPRGDAKVKEFLQARP